MILKEYIRQILLEKSRFDSETGKKHSQDVLQFLLNKTSDNDELPEFGFSMTPSPKIGVNPKSSIDTPGGVYFYPHNKKLFYSYLNDALPYGGGRRYIGIVKFDFSNLKNWLILSNNKSDETKTKQDVDIIKNIVGFDTISHVNKYFGLLGQPEDDTQKAGIANDKVIYHYIKHFLKTKHPNAGFQSDAARPAMTEWMTILKKINVFGIFDRGTDTIWQGEPTQICVLNPKLYKEVGVFESETILSAYKNAPDQDLVGFERMSAVPIRSDILISLKSPEQENYLTKMYKNGNTAYLPSPSIFKNLSDQSKMIVKKYAKIEVFDLLYLGYKNIKSDVILHQNYSIKRLPPNLKIDGSLYLSNSAVETIGDNLQVTGDASFSNSKIRKLPDNCVIKGNLDIQFTYFLDNLPKNLTVGHLNMMYSNVSSIPKDLKILGDGLRKSYLNLAQTEVVKIEDGWTFPGVLTIDTTSRLVQLPKSLHVGTLDLSQSNISVLPPGLIVDDYLILPKKSTIKPPQDLIAGNVIHK